MADELRLAVVKVKGGQWALEAKQKIDGKWSLVGHQGGFPSEAAASAELARIVRGQSEQESDEVKA